MVFRFWFRWDMSSDHPPPPPPFPKCAKCATYEGTETILGHVEVILPEFYNLRDQNFQAPTRLQILMYKFTGLDFSTRLTSILVSAMNTSNFISLIPTLKHIVNIFIQMFPSSPIPLYGYNWIHSNNICLRRRKYSLRWIKVFLKRHYTLNKKFFFFLSPIYSFITF